MSDKVAIPCRISRGGFSEERVFELTVPGVSHRGVACRRHLWDSQWDNPPPAEPSAGHSEDGFVAAKVLDAVDGDCVLVSIPDGEVIRVAVSSLVRRHERATG